MGGREVRLTDSAEEWTETRASLLEERHPVITARFGAAAAVEGGSMAAEKSLAPDHFPQCLEWGGASLGGGWVGGHAGRSRRRAAGRRRHGRGLFSWCRRGTPGKDSAVGWVLPTRAAQRVRRFVSAVASEPRSAFENETVRCCEMWTECGMWKSFSLACQLSGVSVPAAVTCDSSDGGGKGWLRSRLSVVHRH